MLWKLTRSGIAASLFFASLLAGATLLLNPRFVDHLGYGVGVFLALPVLIGALLGQTVGRGLDRLAHIGSSEDPRRALEWLAGTATAFVAFPIGLALLPAYLGTFSASEFARYGGAIVLAVGLALAGAFAVWAMTKRSRWWLWPALLVLPVLAVVLGATEWGRGKAPGSRVLMVAMPGLSWKVVEDLADRGEMPNLVRLRREGAWGDVRSLRPSMATAVWTSIASGKMPDEHGILGFNETAEDVQVSRIWDILGDRGWSVGLFGWPVTAPPKRTNGFVVPAVSDPGTETWPVEANFIRELAMSEKTRRDRTWGRYCRFAFLGIRWGVRLSTLIAAGQEIGSDVVHGRSLDTARLFTRRKLRAKLNCDYFAELRRQRPVDFAAYYTNIVHVAQSYFWKYYDPTEFPGISPDDVARYGDSVQEAYRICDDFLGRILSETEPNDLVIILSDHGAEAVSDASRRTLSLKVEPLLREMRLKGAVEATNLGARTYVRMNPGQEGNRERVRRLFETARLARGDARAFSARVDEWGNVVVTVRPEVATHFDDLVLFQGGRAAVDELVRASEVLESAQMSDTGAIVLQGKGVAPGSRIESGSLLDVVPTLLVLTGHDLAADLPGDVLAEVLDANAANRLPGMVATYDPPGAPRETLR
ncbi:MAG: alkaline phosphatase family protein [Gemmatimonadetes bacterium]|nr:alkaline phosphatase family protein [Gemmatimonadota bacterium]